MLKFFNYINIPDIVDEIKKILNINPSTNITPFFFNPSFVFLNNNKVLLCTRTLIHKNFSTNKLVPGNSDKCFTDNTFHNPLLNKQNKYHTGSEFIWNNWTDSFHKFGSLSSFFLCDYDPSNGKFMNIKLIKKIYRTTHTDTLEEYDFKKNDHSIFNGDLRIAKVNDDIYFYNGSISYSDDNMRFTTCLYKSYVKDDALIFDKIYIPYGPIIDTDQCKSNIPLVDINGKDFLFLDWFYQCPKTGTNYLNSLSFHDDWNGNIKDKQEKIINGIKIVGDGSYIEKYRYRDKSNKSNESNEYDATPKSMPQINNLGNGYHNMPGFSFGTPHIKMNDANGDTIYFGVGHSKIHMTDEQYQYTNKISSFRSKVIEQFNKYFGDFHKPHLGSGVGSKGRGYIYMTYFYKLFKSGDKYEMHISDSYLFVNLNTNINDVFNEGHYHNHYKNQKRYMFSLQFPMGLQQFEDQIIVTMGEGDFYSINLVFDKEKLLNIPYHNIQTIDMNNYNYYIYCVKDNKQSIQSSLNECINEINKK